VDWDFLSGRSQRENVGRPQRKGALRLALPDGFPPRGGAGVAYAARAGVSSTMVAAAVLEIGIW
jgi:hypothetical protein